MPYDIRTVQRGRDLSRFVDLPFRLFGGDPEFVPPLRVAVKDRLSPKHPAQRHQEFALWMAYEGGRPVGRIGACIDSSFNEFQNLKWAWIGFFESIDDPDVAHELFLRAWSWSRERKAEMAVGPGSFTTNDDCGLLVEGHEFPPVALTPHNPPYYEALWTKNGWEPAMDLYGWRFRSEWPHELTERQNRMVARVTERYSLRIRSVDMKNFDQEVERFFRIYNSAWSKNWGFAPMDRDEVKHLAKDLKLIVDPELALLMDRGNPDEPVAAALAIPDLNLVVKKIPSGRLLPSGWYHLLTGRKKIRNARVILLGIRPEAQSLALGPVLYKELVDRLRSRGYDTVEASWTLATNDRINQPMRDLGAVRYKTWRMYQYRL